MAAGIVEDAKEAEDLHRPGLYNIVSVCAIDVEILKATCRPAPRDCWWNEAALSMIRTGTPFCVKVNAAASPDGPPPI